VGFVATAPFPPLPFPHAGPRDGERKRAQRAAH
jgi:hypothetical protein